MTDLQIVITVLVVGFGALAILMIVAIRLELFHKRFGRHFAFWPNRQIHGVQTDSETALMHAQPIMHVERDMHIVFGDKENPQIDIALCASPQGQHFKAVPLANEISDYLLKVGNLYGLGNGVRTLQVQFSSKVTRQLANGQLELMKSALGNKAIAVDPLRGHTREIANAVTAINPVVAAAFAWQVLAFATAQKYLADIINVWRILKRKWTI